MNTEVFDHFLDAVFLISSNGVIIYCNQGAVALFQFSLKRTVGKSSLENIMQLTPSFESQGGMDHKASDEGLYREYEFKTPSGVSGAVNLVWSKIQMNGEERMLVIMRDVSIEKLLHSKYNTERREKSKLLEQDLERRVQLQIINSEYDRKLFHMNCLVEFGQRTRSLTNGSQVLNELGQYVVSRFQFMGGLIIHLDASSVGMSLQFISSIHIGRTHFNFQDWNSILKKLTVLDMKSLPEEVHYRDTLNDDWKEFLACCVDVPQDSMMSMRVKLSEKSQVMMVFTLPSGQKGPTADDMNLIEALKQQAEVAIENTELKYLSMTDEMTGLFNKRYMKMAMFSEMKKALDDAKAFSIMIADVDHFKKFNDTHGHLAGDFVLKSVAEVLRASCRLTDICCRYGGEEFVVILPLTPLEGGLLVAERVRQFLADRTFDYEGKTLNVTASFGVAQWSDGEEMEDLIAHADEALYTAKRNGRNKVETYRK
ncbi:MAG: GGDEF domain-containing protein [Bdellovibrio sp.]